MPRLEDLRPQIMAGVLIKELPVRGDLQRSLVVCPGKLVDRWQDELYLQSQPLWAIFAAQLH
jgi:hypothetical protein